MLIISITEQKFIYLGKFHFKKIESCHFEKCLALTGVWIYEYYA